MNAALQSSQLIGVTGSAAPNALALYRIMYTARIIDRVEMELVNRGEAFFHVGGAGHEASASLNSSLTPNDWLHLHYRDKALMLARGLSIDQFFTSLLCTQGSHSEGRQMSAHFSAPELKILSLVGPVGNNALQAVGIAHEVRNRIGNPIVVCSVGDGTSQQGEFLEAIAEAVRFNLPVLFLIEDNQLAISTATTGKTFYDRPGGPAAEFYGLPIHRLDGRSPLDCELEFQPIVHGIRTSRRPAIVVLQADRLTHHTNADDERIYRPEDEIRRVRATSDPVAVLRQHLCDGGFALSELESLEREIEISVRGSADRALQDSNPTANFDARIPLAPPLGTRNEYRGSAKGGRLSMLEAIREVLRHQLNEDRSVTISGQDLEDPKGDVFGLTRGLSTSFPGRVVNSALSESTIVGVGIGRALAGGHPVACIQFADFIPLAFNQIASELGSIYWRTSGGWRAPLIIMAPCGGYRPGLGPFHAQTFESILAHVPGIDVVMPSTAGDAAGLLNAAFATRRPTVFLYPKVALNVAAVSTSTDCEQHWVLPGRARFITRGNALTIVTWGGTVSLCEKAVEALQSAGLTCDLIDLRSLSPWDVDAVCQSSTRTGKLLVVHEDNLTCGFGAEVVATVCEKVTTPLQVRRITRPDTYVPCNYANQLEVLPSFTRILETAAKLCQATVEWSSNESTDNESFVVEAVGSSPADQSVEVVEWKVQPGQAIKAGDLIAECEADKATFELRAPVEGIILDLLAENLRVPVGNKLARIKTYKPQSVQGRRIPIERVPRVISTAPSAPSPSKNGGSTSLLLNKTTKDLVGISTIHVQRGGRIVTNRELAVRFPGRTADDILQRTGIESRPLLAAGETALSLAVSAVRGAFRDTGLGLRDLDAIFVSTSSPLSISPSMACLLHHQLTQTEGAKDVPASDILAACSGYLYALQAACDFCQSRPSANILVVTAEAMSTFTDPNDFDTAIVFADAATATLVHGSQSPRFEAAPARVRRPVLSARGEDGTILNHGRRDHPTVNMDGLKVFPMAVRQLIALLKEACVEGKMTVEDLDYIIPHQANGRILDAVDVRLKLPKGRLLNRVRHSGNTSSSTIPVVLADLIREKPIPGSRAGLCAFGGGFTFGAAVLEFV